MTVKQKAIGALLGTIFLWSFMVIIARFAVLRVSAIYLLFLRLLVASICFLPFFLKSRVWRNKRFKSLVLISLGSTINLTFFMLGIQYTTASASQIIYAAIPILVL